MKIAEINMLHNGSTGKIMFGIAECARKEGHDVKTFSPIVYIRHGKMQKKEIDHHTYFGYEFENALHIVLAELTGFQGCFSYFGTKQLIKNLKKFNPDVIHLHNLHNRCINIPMLFSYIKKNNIKTVWTLHDCWSFTGQCPYFTMVKCDKWKYGCHKCVQTKEYLKTYVNQTRLMWKLKKKWFSNIEDMTIITPSVWLANLVKQSFLKEYDIKVINNGIDLNIFKPTDSSFREKYNIENEFIILGVAFDWGKRKGLDVFIELANSLDNKFQIVLVGTTSMDDESLPDNIISIHQTNNQTELAQIYSAANVFVIPTREDNYPTVNMESISCGVPVISFDTGGSPEMINKKTGIVVSCDDIVATKEAIMKIYNEPYDYRKNDCLNEARKFDMNDRFKEYVALYEERNLKV